MRFLFTLSLIILLEFQLFCQNACTIQGSVIDLSTKQVLIGATVYDTISKAGTSTNTQGVFQLETSCTATTIKISYLGYKDLILHLNPSINQDVKIQLSPLNYQVEGVEISAEKPDENITSGKVGTVKLDNKEIEKLPSLMGNPDIIAGIRLTPGVQAGGEGNSGIYVRGGDAGQNLILLNDIPLYNPSHLMGFFPAFNANIVDNISVSKGAIPANYGGKVSSVIDIKTKDWQADKLKIKGSVGLLSTDATVSTPILDNKEEE